MTAQARTEDNARYDIRYPGVCVIAAAPLAPLRVPPRQVSRGGGDSDGRRGRDAAAAAGGAMLRGERDDAARVHALRRVRSFFVYSVHGVHMYSEWPRCSSGCRWRRGGMLRGERLEESERVVQEGRVRE